MAHIRAHLTWGMLDQGLSSLTNLALTLVGARLTGPAGLGVVAIGFTGYIVALTLQRTLLSQPIILTSSTEGDERREAATRIGLTMTVVVAVVAAIVMATVGLLVQGVIGRGLLVFAPWIVPALVQDYWRNILFRDERGRDATLNDAVWVVAMVVALPLATYIRTDWAIVAVWGIGATLATCAGFAQLRAVPERISRSWAWWASGEGWRLGRWFAAEGLTYAFLAQATTLVIASVLGASSVGGLRAARTVFAPLTLFGPAIVLPGLPAMTHAVSASLDNGRRLALKLSGVLLVATGIYVIVVGAAGGAILSLVFGESFGGYGELALPIGIQQALISGGIGFYLLLKATRRGRALFTFRLIEAVATIVLVALAANWGGLMGAAWVLTAGAAFGLLWKLYYSYRVLGATAPSHDRRVVDAKPHA